MKFTTRAQPDLTRKSRVHYAFKPVSNLFKKLGFTVKNGQRGFISRLWVNSTLSSHLRTAKPKNLLLAVVFSCIGLVASPAYADDPTGGFLNEDFRVNCDQYFDPNNTALGNDSICINKSLEYWDRQLNAIWSEAFATSAPAELKNSLRKAQRGWLAQRDGTCEFIALYYADARSFIRSNFEKSCLAVLTKRRYEDLKKLTTGMFWR